MSIESVSQSPPRYLRAAGASDYLKISKSCLWSWCKTQADFPKPIKAGPRVTLFDVQAIEKFLARKAKPFLGA